MTTNDANNVMQPIASENSLPESRLPEYVDIDKWADQGYHWQGNFQLVDYSRLAEMISEKVDKGAIENLDNQANVDAPLTFSITRSGGIYWFKFEVKAVLETQCQRCLKQMDLTFAKQVTLAILEDKEQANQLDEEEDWVLIEDVAEQVGREIRLPIATVIEDELLLEVPLSPKHPVNDPDCVPVEFIEEEDEEVEEKENPFAMLAGLKEELAGSKN